MDLGSCGCALHACMETQFRRPAISKVRAVHPKLGAEATLLSLLSYFSESFKKSIREVLLFDDAG